MHTGFWWDDLVEKTTWKTYERDEKIILKWIFEKWDGEARTRLF